MFAQVNIVFFLIAYSWILLPSLAIGLPQKIEERPIAAVPSAPGLILVCEAQCCEKQGQDHPQRQEQHQAQRQAQGLAQGWE